MTGGSNREGRSLPPGVESLGYAGVAPFAAGVLGIAFLEGPAGEFALRAVVAYGAVILSFVGAVHWGLVLARPAAGTPQRLLAAVLPSVAGWAALLLPGRPALTLLVVAFGAFWLYEHRVLGPGLLPVEYLGLRRKLTLAVCSLLALAVIALG